MMLERIKAKRDAVNAEIELHKAAINNLIDKLEVYNEIIKEEESLVVAAEENIEAEEAVSEESDDVVRITLAE